MDINSLINKAKAVRLLAYAPYSKFKVGAVVLADDNEVFGGCNIENSSYGLCNCAERSALFNAYSENKRQIKMMVVVADSSRPVPPCGACRQVMSELCPSDMPVILTNLKGDIMETTVEQLLPGSFSAEDLNGK